MWVLRVSLRWARVDVLGTCFVAMPRLFVSTSCKHAGNVFDSDPIIQLWYHVVTKRIMIDGVEILNHGIDRCINHCINPWHQSLNQPLHQPLYRPLHEPLQPRNNRTIVSRSIICVVLFLAMRMIWWRCCRLFRRQCWGERRTACGIAPPARKLISTSVLPCRTKTSNIIFEGTHRARQCRR